MQNKTSRSRRAIVVGSGVAGMAAAHTLHRDGFEVVVLESESRIGGRTSTLEKDGFRIDLAATMMLKTYKRTVELITEIGAQASFEPSSDILGVLRDGTIHHIRGAHPLDAVTTGLLSARAKVAIARIAKDVLLHRKQLDWRDPTTAADMQFGTMRDYADTRVRNTELRDHLIDPACRFLCLSPLEQVSAVDFLFLARNMGKTSFFNSPNGIDTLARLLAHDVQVQTQSRVTLVEESSDGVTVGFQRAGGDTESIKADVCVLAVPAPTLVDIYPAMGPIGRQALSSTIYAPAINVFVGVDSPPTDPSALIFIPETDDPELACAILDHNKASGRVPPGAGLISTYWQRDWTEKHWESSDEEILADALPSVERLLPGSTSSIRTVHVQRWKDALISGPTSRYANLARLRAVSPASSRIRMAGDALSSSNINSCVCSGERAAAELTFAHAWPRAATRV